MGILQMYSTFQLLKTSLNNWSVYTTVSTNFLRCFLKKEPHSHLSWRRADLFPQIISLHFKLSPLTFRFYILLRNKAKNDNYLVPSNHILSFVVLCSLLWQCSVVAIIFRSIKTVNSKIL